MSHHNAMMQIYANRPKRIKRIPEVFLNEGDPDEFPLPAGFVGQGYNQFIRIMNMMIYM